MMEFVMYHHSKPHVIKHGHLTEGTRVSEAGLILQRSITLRWRAALRCLHCIHNSRSLGWLLAAGVQSHSYVMEVMQDLHLLALHLVLHR